MLWAILRSREEGTGLPQLMNIQTARKKEKRAVKFRKMYFFMTVTLQETVRTQQLQLTENIIVDISLAALAQGQNQTFGGF